MKKLFAFALVIFILISNCCIRAEAATTQQEGPYKTADSAYTEEEERERLKQPVYRLEIIKQLTSWDELVDAILPKNGDYAKIVNKEDYNLVMLIKNVNNTQLFSNTSNIKITLSGLSVEGMEYERFVQKCETVIDIYNQSNSLTLVWEPIVTDGKYMQIKIMSSDLVELEIGQKVAIKEDTQYWESSAKNGSGKYGVVEENNKDIPKGFIVTVNGCAYLDKNGKIVLESYYYPYNKMEGKKIEMKDCKNQMIHICTAQKDLGWIHVADIAKFDCK